jgi:hypothetical protein
MVAETETQGSGTDLLAIISVFSLFSAAFPPTATTMATINGQNVSH